MQVELATPADNAELLGLLRHNPLPGSITLGFEREPDYFRAAAEGTAEAHAVIARDPNSGRITCVAEVALRHVFVNGVPVRGAYLANWRMDRAWRGRVAFLETCLAFFAKLQEERLRADVFYSAIVAENMVALQRLERRRPGPGNFQPLDDLVTFLVPTRPMRRPEPPGSRCDAEDAAELRRFLAERLGRFQFASDWHAPELSAGTAPRADAFLALRRNGAIAACAAIWDQRASKQVVVRDYSRRLRALRPIHNATTRLTGKPPLPPQGTSLALASIAGFAVAGDDPATAVALLDALRGSGAYELGIAALALTLSARHPARAAIARRLNAWTYRSRLYHVSMPGAAPLGTVLSDRPAQPEAALL